MFMNTRVDSILITNQVDELVVAGLDAAECVNATIEAAIHRRYRSK
jgi:nicotinamidase-related amidase